MTVNQKSEEENTKEPLPSKEPFSCSLWRYDHRPQHYHPHWHDFLELIFIRKGYMRVTLRNTMLTINEEELLVVMPGELHSTENDGKNILEFIVMQVDSAILQNAIFESKELSMIYPYLLSYWAPHSFVCAYDEIKKARIAPLINRLYSEIEKKELGYSLSVRAGLLEIFVWLLRRWNVDNQPVSEADNFSLYVRMKPILNHIKEQYQKNITTNEMADKMAISVPHFCRLFKKLTGYSFHNYLRSLRIVEAIKLLLSTDNSVSQIASMVGYNDVNFFVRVFKKQTGLPPFQYRKKYTSPLPLSPL